MMRKLLILVGIGAGMLLASRAFPMGCSFREGPDVNPAIYSLRGASRVDFLSAGASAGNNAFSMGDYSLYNGKFITEADKEEILGSVPESGLHTRAQAYAGMGAALHGRFYVAGGGRAGENSTMPRDILDLALYGNQIGRTYSMDRASGEAMAVADISLAYSMPLDLRGREFFAGARVHYLKGLAYGGVVRASGCLYTGEESLTGEGEMVVRMAEGGSGYSIDLGLAHRTYSHIIIGAYILNAVSSIKWTDGCKEEINGVIADNVAFGGSDLDSLIDDYHETRDLAGFSTGIAPVLGLGLEKSTRWTYLSILYTQGFRQGAFTSGEPRLSVTGAWDSVWILDLRVGLAYESGFGLDERVEIGFGRSPRLEIGAGFAPLPYASSMKHFGVTLGMSYRL
ncbi:MAG: DUF5723 family protein [bacterium]|jgi:hypothetical protein